MKKTIIRSAQPDGHSTSLDEQNALLGTIGSGTDPKALRRYFATHTQAEVRGVARAKALAEWREAVHYCPRCGQALGDHPQLTAMLCPDCGEVVFPRIDPCVIVLVSRGNEILLARHVQRNRGIYACIAGFVEAGETLEQAVEREVMEETGIQVRNIRYFGSQSWPFPRQIMIGFTAEWESGEIVVQPDEIADAQWFAIDHCPATPAPGSLAFELIEAVRRRIYS